jgi:hypothetical protein
MHVLFDLLQLQGSRLVCTFWRAHCGTEYIQLERRGLHHINSDVGHMIIACNRSIINGNNVDETEGCLKRQISDDEDDSEDEDDSNDDEDEDDAANDISADEVCNSILFFFDLVLILVVDVAAPQIFPCYSAAKSCCGYPCTMACRDQSRGSG